MKVFCFVCMVPMPFQASSGLAADSPQRAFSHSRQDMVLGIASRPRSGSEAMPLGNGLMGAMVFGGIQQERIALNESSFWSGRPHDYDNPEASSTSPRFAIWFLPGSSRKPKRWPTSTSAAPPRRSRPISRLATCCWSFDGARRGCRLPPRTGPGNRRRRSQLSLRRRGLHPRGFRLLARPRSGRAASPPTSPAACPSQAQFKSPVSGQSRSPSPAELVMDGCWKGPIRRQNWLIAPVEGKGLRFQAALAALPEGGRSEAADGSLRIRKRRRRHLHCSPRPPAMSTTTTSAATPRPFARRSLADCAGTDYADPPPPP